MSHKKHADLQRNAIDLSLFDFTVIASDSDAIFLITYKIKEIATSLRPSQ